MRVCSVAFLRDSSATRSVSRDSRRHFNTDVRYYIERRQCKKIATKSWNVASNAAPRQVYKIIEFVQWLYHWVLSNYLYHRLYSVMTIAMYRDTSVLVHAIYPKYQTPRMFENPFKTFLTFISRALSSCHFWALNIRCQNITARIFTTELLY